ncbi:MAG: S-layer homology domain-containing protein [Phormidesmis sp.]
MTQPFSKNRAFSVLCALLFLTACSGSRLGDSVGKSLEPDPQLVEQADSAAPATSTPAQTPTKTPAASDSKTEETETTQPPEEKAAAAPNPEEGKVVGGKYNDLGKAPEEIQEYLVDLLELDLLAVRSPTPPTNNASNSATTNSETTNSATTNAETDQNDDDSTANDDNDNKPNSEPPPKADIPGPNEFRPNKAITRREYARWLLATNNKYYAGQRNRKIRPGVTSSAPVFQDVSIKDPDFAAIQGLAEAGIIPSPLTGSSTTVTFRPDAPLTRKDLLLWKVPLDTRQPLPQATPDAVKEAWGFQDAGKIDPRALQAVLADYQNGDFANIRRAFGYTTLFQPAKAATRAEAAAVLWRIGNATEAITAQEIRNPGNTNGSDAE